MIEYLAAFMMSGASPQSELSLDKALDFSLGTGGLTRETAKIDPTLADFYRQGDFSVPLYRSAFEDPWRFPNLINVNVRELTLAREQAFKSVSMSSRLSGYGSRRDLLGDPATLAFEKAKQPNSLQDSLQKMKARSLISGDIPPLDGVPVEIQQAAALIINMCLDTVEYRGATFSELSSLQAKFDSARNELNGALDPVGFRTSLSDLHKVDMAYLYAGAQDVASAVWFASSHLSAVSPATTYHWSLNTGWGVITLSGGSDQTYDDSVFLILDTGGDDTYINCPTNRSLTNWVSCVIDQDGADKYLSHKDLAGKLVKEATSRQSERKKAGPGSATFGLSFLYDAKGDDLYRSLRPSFGSATFGVAVHLDQEGHDVYDTYVDSLGYARFGLGMLEDGAGSDEYHGFNQVQGVGLTAGVGILIDRSGNDIYNAEDEVIDFPSPQSAEHNVSMAQGAGYGLRHDYVNGRSLAGGIGMLVDYYGEDTYKAGVFAQGVGYWMGTGILYDKDGKDNYSGQWYVQGSSAHFGIGYLEDVAGNDEYTASINMALGAGHDFGYGFFLDRAGDDIYRGANLSLGAGNANGVGAFLDFKGNDTYESSGPTSMGRARPGAIGSVREVAFSLGLFADLGGNDNYARNKDWTKNGHAETELAGNQNIPKDNQIGIFFDR